jgi:hypothetical protein
MTGVVKSRYYRVRVSAKNAIGTGPVSNIAYILAADKPSQPTDVILAISNSNVNVSWTLPDNGGSAIIQGQV